VCVNSYGILYHELYHAVDYIARNIDGETILYNEHKNSEPRAYLYQYLANQANTFFWGNKMKGKKQ